MTEYSHSVRVRASSAGEWLQCGQRRWHKERQAGSGNPDMYVPHVGQEVGNAVHHAITGHDYQPAESIIYDKHTSAHKEFLWQVELMVKLVREYIDGQGWVVPMETEKYMKREATIDDVLVYVEGSADIIVRNEIGQIVVIDLKTGARRPSNTFIQLAIYAWLTYYVTGDMPAKVGLLWVPRNKMVTGGMLEPIFQAGEPLVKVAWNTIRTIADYSTHGYPYDPGTMNCSPCAYINCPVRMAPAQI